jgi:hypothetical protein
MKERIARPIGEFNEAKPLFGVEPFDDPSDGRAGRWLEPGLAEPGSGSESRKLWVVGIGVEVATPRMKKILLSR